MPKRSEIKKAQPLDIYLETLSFEDRVRWWVNKKPYDYRKYAYQIDGITKLTADDIETDGRGNLKAVARAVASACFGQIVPFVRFRKYEYDFNKRTKKPYQSRCYRCKARSACKMIVAERISVAQNGLALLDLSNERMFAQGDPEHNAFISCSPHGFRHAILQHGDFEDANAELVKKLRSERQARERARDATYKKRSRRRGYRSGRVDPLYVGAAIAERDRRVEVLQRERLLPQAPRSLSRLPLSSCQFIADVWLCEWLHRWTTPNLRAVDVADWLIQHRRHQWQDRASLQGRVTADRARAKQFETKGFPPLWTPFDPEEAIDAGRVVDASRLTLI
ncbi:hypothetical protein [Sphingomonas solaris]|uniref:Uncharacterized protein n=1 Tax=Alterirhizorhabdus solaris TaxID=2529389 RepID=A0A558RCI4_9SPHN|nr:hypothetical protein [Sphingomonas solaris]TVV77175.1 hypothetical protein FOY91_02290 [Sphingomonas solaris]